MEQYPDIHHHSEEEAESDPNSSAKIKPSWEYQLFVRDLELDNAPDEDELNPLGAEGWELVGIFVHANMLYCYFKRQN